MSKRLQVLMDEADLEEIRAIAEHEGMTVSEWVRRAIKDARRTQSSADPARKLEAIRNATEHSFPTGDIDEVLEQIERGYLDDRR